MGKEGCQLDKIFLKGVAFYGYHGVLPEENVLGQKFVMDVTLFVDTRRAGQTDVLDQTISYAEVYEICKRHGENARYLLLERLAHKISEDILKAYPACERVIVAVNKPNPPIAGHYECVGVEVDRERSDFFAE